MEDSTTSTAKCLSSVKLGASIEEEEHAVTVGDQDVSHNTEQSTSTPLDQPLTPWDQPGVKISGDAQDLQDFLNQTPSKIDACEGLTYYFRVSERQFWKINQELQSLQISQRFPILDFDTRTSIVTVTLGCSCLHDFVAKSFIDSFQSTESRLETEQDGIATGMTKSFKIVQGPWKGSYRAPDAYVASFDVKGSLALRLVVEVGVSQCSEILHGKAKMWIEGHNDVQIVALVDLKEDPRYKSPLATYTKAELVGLGVDSYDVVRSAPVTSRHEDGLGPMSILGFDWTGELTGTFSMWRRNQHDGKVQMIDSSQRVFMGAGIEDGDAIEPTTIDLSEIDPKFQGLTNETVTVDWNKLRKKAKLAWKEDARDRCMMEFSKKLGL